MPHYFFDLVGPQGVEADEVGLEFNSLEFAYLEADRAARAIAAEMLHARTSPAGHYFALRDAARRLVIEVPFEDFLRRRRPPPAVHANTSIRTRLADTIRRNRELRAEISTGLERARVSLSTAQEVLKRSSS